MANYRIYQVTTFTIRPERRIEGEKWWQNTGKGLIESLPGVKSVHAYAAQFGLGSEYQLEVWTELESYAALDEWDRTIAANPQKYRGFGEAAQYFEYGPGRVVGDWPASDLLSEG